MAIGQRGTIFQFNVELLFGNVLGKFKFKFVAIMKVRTRSPLTLKHIVLCGFQSSKQFYVFISFDTYLSSFHFITLASSFITWHIPILTNIKSVRVILKIHLYSHMYFLINIKCNKKYMYFICMYSMYVRIYILF